MEGSTLFGGAFASFATFAGIALLCWVNNKSESKKLELDQTEKEREHAKRMKALEMGFPPDEIDLAQVKANVNRVWAAGLVGFLVPLGVMGCAVGTTALVLNLCGSHLHLAGLGIIWGVSGTVSFLALVLSLGVMKQSLSVPRPPYEAKPRKTESTRKPDLSTAIQE